MNATPLKPPVPYFGGKQMIAPWIVSLLPDHERLMAHSEGDHGLCEPDCGVKPAAVPAEVTR